METKSRKAGDAEVSVPSAWPQYINSGSETANKRAARTRRESALQLSKLAANAAMTSIGRRRRLVLLAGN